MVFPSPSRQMEAQYLDKTTNSFQILLDLSVTLSLNTTQSSMLIMPLNPLQNRQLTYTIDAYNIWEINHFSTGSFFS